MFHLKNFYFKLLINTFIILCIISAAFLLFTINHLDTVFVSGDLLIVFKGKTFEFPIKENYYLLCILKKVIITFWETFFSENLNNSFLMAYFLGSDTPNSIIYLNLINYIKQIITLLFLFSFILLMIPLTKVSKATSIIEAILFKILTLLLWIGIIYFRGDYTSSYGNSSFIPSFILFAIEKNQELFLSLLLIISEYTFHGIIFIYIIFSNGKRFFLLLLIGISLGWVLYYLLFNFWGGMECSEFLSKGLSPFKV